MGDQYGGDAATDPCLDPRGEPFLTTRLLPPARPAVLLHRERLTAVLDRAVTTPLTLVRGPAGAGKTLLVADWAARLDRPVAWLTLEDTDRSPGVFWAYLLHALRTAGPSLPPGVGTPKHADRVEPTLPGRLAAGLGVRDTPVLLVLDEFERATRENADRLEFLLHHAGNGLRLIVLSRGEPPLPLHRHRLAGDVTEVDAAALAFTPGETTALLAAHGLRPTEEATRALTARTRGWAAGTRLCALAARQSPDPERSLLEPGTGHGTLAGYLDAEVLRRQPPAAQDLLIRVSVLDRFRPALADVLTGRDDAEAVLAGLLRNDAFVEPLEHAWYRLHPLFAEALRARLRERHPGLEPELHRRAARWLARHGTLTETLAHGAAAGDWEFTCATLVDDLAIGRLFTGEGADGPAGLFSAFGTTDDADATGPAGNLVLAARELGGPGLRHGLAHLRLAQDELSLTDPADRVPARLACTLLEALAARLTGSPGRAEWAAELARNLRRTLPAGLLDQHPELTALLLTHVGSTRLWAGNFEGARAALTAAARSPGGAATALPRQEAIAHLALIDCLDGWTDRARVKALDAQREAERYALPASARSAVAPLVLAVVAVERDELDTAQALLDRAAGAGGTRDPVVRACFSLAGARLLLARGEGRAAMDASEPGVSAVVASPWADDQAALVEAAVRLAEGDTESAAKTLEPAAGRGTACAVAAARVHLAAGDVEEALRLLDGLPTHGRAGPALTVRAALARAQAADRAGDAAYARHLVTDALLAARPERMRRPFIEAGPWIRPLLAALPARDPARQWLAVRGATAPSRARPRQFARTAEELSPRERDVLRRLAQFMSAEEIAADLYVSVNTVKTHLKNIYRKLSVNRRGDAVRRARDLGLL